MRGEAAMLFRGSRSAAAHRSGAGSPAEAASLGAPIGPQIAGAGPSAGRRPASGAEHAIYQKPRRLLVIDDDAAFGRLVKRVAQPLGFKTLLSDRLDLEQLKEWRPRIIILDLQMPGADGIEILRRLAAAGYAARIHLASGSVDERTLERAAELAGERGLDIGPVLRKPLRIDTLRAVLGGAEREAAPGVSRPRSAGVSAAELAAAIAAGQLFLQYQPQLQLPAGRIGAAEALVRWRHPTCGIVPPDRFIPLAERSGLIEPLTAWVIAAALAAAREWKRRGSPLDIAINISVHNLHDFGLPDRIGRKCEEFGIAPDSVTLELTESDVMADPVSAMDVLLRLRVKGFKLSVDDFGTGHSSLVRLHRLPFSEIKIDRSFVMKLLDNAECASIVGAVVGLARKLNLRCVAEGVESAAVLERLVRLGCDGAQGYHIGCPASAEALVACAEVRPRPEAASRNRFT